MKLDTELRVIKIGDHEVAASATFAELARALRGPGGPAVLVHGGGRALDALQARLGLETVKVDGLRVTDADTLEAALMAFCGVVNKRLVAGLRIHGVDAFGISGVDGGLLRSAKLQRRGSDLGFVGEVVEVRADLLLQLLAAGITPVLAPVSLGPGGEIYNVNADQVAGAVAAAISASRLDLVSDVRGVIVDGAVLSRLGEADGMALIASGQVQGGMVPKVRAALAALRSGVREVRIASLQELAGQGGTSFALETPVNRSVLEAGS